MLRAFVGGARRPETAGLPEDELRRTTLQQLTAWLGIKGEPAHCSIARWPRTMPQYHVGHIQLVERIEALAAALPGLELAGNAYHGVGIPNCIHSGEGAAERVLKGAD